MLKLNLRILITVEKGSLFLFSSSLLLPLSIFLSPILISMIANESLSSIIKIKKYEAIEDLHHTAPWDGILIKLRWIVLVRVGLRKTIGWMDRGVVHGFRYAHVCTPRALTLTGRLILARLILQLRHFNSN